MLVLAVMAFHYTIAWAGEKQDVYGFDHQYSPNFAFGALAVQVFFLISGFFITVTLVRSKDAFEFLFKRVVRIFPALIVSATLTFLVIKLFSPAIFDVHFGDYIASMTLIFKFGARWVDGAYWSLAVEFKYYLWIGLFAWAMGSRFWIGTIGLAFAGSLVSLASHRLAEDIFLAPYMSYFLAGMGAAHQVVVKNGRAATWLYCSAAIVFACQLGQLAIWQNLAVAIASGFVLFLLISNLRVELPVLPYIGLISYEIYLVHQKVGITVIGIVKRTSHAPDLTAMLIAALVSIGLAAFIHHIAQKPVIALITRAYRSARPSQPVKSV